MTDDLRKAREATDETLTVEGFVDPYFVDAERAAADAEIARLNLLLRFREEQNIQISKGTESLMREIAEGKKREERFADCIQKFKARSDSQREWLNRFGQSCFSEQMHTREGTIERVYWHYGYLVALSDVIAALSGGTDEAK